MSKYQLPRFLQDYKPADPGDEPCAWTPGPGRHSPYRTGCGRDYFRPAALRLLLQSPSPRCPHCGRPIHKPGELRRD